MPPHNLKSRNIRNSVQFVIACPLVVSDGDGEKELVDIEIDGAILTATDNHPFWVVNVGAWIDARDLQVGDIVLADDGQQLTIDNVKPYSLADQVVHNLTVDDLHTYYVVAGSESVLVHNCKANPWTTAATSHAPRNAINKIGDLTPAEKDILKGIWDGGHRSRLPLKTRQQLADYFSGVAGKNPAGSAQAAFNQARADYLLGRGPNPGRSVNAFAERFGIPKFRGN
mgnify:CR=1 FL=1